MGEMVLLNDELSGLATSLNNLSPHSNSQAALTPAPDALCHR